MGHDVLSCEWFFLLLFFFLKLSLEHTRTQLNWLWVWFYYKGQPVWTVCVIWIVEKPPHECRDSCSCSCRANCSLNKWEWPCRCRCGIAWLLSLGSVPVIPSLRRVPQVCCGHQPLCNLYFALLRIFSYFPLLDQAEGS